MGVFENLGRRVGEFTAEAKAAARENAAFRCEACDARFNERTEECPECGAESVVPNGTGGTDGTDETGS